MKGITLMETLIAMGISAIVGTLLLVIIINSTSLFSNQSSKLSEGLSANEALAKIRTTIRDAKGVAASYTDSGTTYTTSSGQLVLEVPSIDSSGNIIQDTIDYFVFYKDQTKLRLKSFPAPSSFRKSENQIFSNLTDTLLFQYFNLDIPPAEVAPTTASKIKISLTLKQKNGLDYQILTATSEANLRND